MSKAFLPNDFALDLGAPADAVDLQDISVWHAMNEEPDDTETFVCPRCKGTRFNFASLVSDCGFEWTVDAQCAECPTTISVDPQDPRVGV